MSIEIKNGNFREDLFHRLNVFNIKIDPLNKRIEDIPMLIDYFIDNICKTYSYKKFSIKTIIIFLIMIGQAMLEN